MKTSRNGVLPGRWQARDLAWKGAACVAAALVLIVAMRGAAPAASGPPPSPDGYKLITTIPLPGPAGHGDWVAYDPSNGYVYISHHGANVVVVDTKTDKVVANIESPDLDKPNGNAFDSKYLYVTAEKPGKVVIISKETWNIVGSAKTKGPSPDGIWVDPTKGRLYVISDDANQVEVYDTGNQPNLVAVYPLIPEKPQSGPDVGVLVPSKNALYEPDDALILAVNPDTGKITRSLDTHLKIGKTGATKNMVYDPKNNQLWVATTNQQVWIVNPDTLAKINTVKATEGDDAMDLDVDQRLVYAFGGHGFDVYNADTMDRVAYVNTGGPDTHTGAVNTANHRVYVYEGQANLLGVYQRQ